MSSFPELIERQLLKNGSGLLPAQAKAIAALAMGLSTTSAAVLAGVHRATVHNWKNEPAFLSSLASASSEYTAFFEDSLKEIASQAFDTIRHILTTPGISPAVRLRAALAVIDRPVFPLLPAQDVVPVTQPAARPDTSVPRPEFQPAYPLEPVDLPRNAQCPCGSGSKYKRCCGVYARPVLFQAA